MADTPSGYEKQIREVFVKKDAELSDSRKHDGLKSALTRGRETNELSHAVIGDEVEPGDVDEVESGGIYSWRDSEGAPDISGLVPLALVAVAGIAVGAVGIKAAESFKKKRLAAKVEPSKVGPASAAPAGWYEVAGDATQLRYWDGFAWTDDYAQRAVAAPRIAADWYPDPRNAAQMRYWDGGMWTQHVSPAPGSVTTPADWYPDPSSPAQLRYWDGNAWTGHIANGSGAVVGLQRAHANTSGGQLAPAQVEPKINMTSSEWKALVEAWLRVGAVQQELWRRLSNANIEDADQLTLEAQRRMEALTPEEAARRIQLMLESSPALREQGSLLDLMRLLGGVQGVPLGIEVNRRREGSR